jgi:bifunctional non-homologous end joining protein LigD
VAAPRTWAEIERGADKPGTLGQLDMDQVLARVVSGGDVFADALSPRT